MNKTELISAVATKTGFTKKDVKSAIDATFEIITETLVAGDSVGVTDFGKFDAPERAARESRNPQTGEPITVAAHKAPRFKPSSALKNAVK